MASQIVSFRLSDDEVEILDAMRRADESVNQAAARLLRERMGLGTVYDTSTVRTQQLQEWLEQIVDAKIDYITNSCQQIVDTKVDSLEKRLHVLEEVPAKATKPRAKKSLPSSGENSSKLN